MPADFVEEFDEGEEPTTSEPAPEAPAYTVGPRGSQQSDSIQTRVGEDGTLYEFDEKLRAWFPKVDGDAYDAYMSNYGNGESLVEEAEQKYREQRESVHLNKKRKKAEVVEEAVENTCVYFENLPPDVTVEEVAEFFGRRCGVVAQDHKGKKRVKLYKDAAEQFNGTGLCFFHRVESVALAIQLLDDTEMRDGCVVKVTQAEFKEQKMVKKKKMKASARDEKSKGQDKLLDWTERNVVFKSKKAKCTVVLLHMFDPKDFENDAGEIYDLKEEIRPEFEKIGDVSKLIVFDRHADGVVSVTYKEEKHALKCIKKMHGRLFDGRRIVAQSWDGVTKYDIEETKEQAAQRIAKFEKDITK